MIASQASCPTNNLGVIIPIVGEFCTTHAVNDDDTVRPDDKKRIYELRLKIIFAPIVSTKREKIRELRPL